MSTVPRLETLSLFKKLFFVRLPTLDPGETEKYVNIGPRRLLLCNRNVGVGSFAPDAFGASVNPGPK